MNPKQHKAVRPFEPGNCSIVGIDNMAQRLIDDHYGDDACIRLEDLSEERKNVWRCRAGSVLARFFTKEERLISIEVCPDHQSYL